MRQLLGPAVGENIRSHRACQRPRPGSRRQVPTLPDTLQVEISDVSALERRTG
jgi:hypothetical protein